MNPTTTTTYQVTDEYGDVTTVTAPEPTTMEQSEKGPAWAAPKPKKRASRREFEPDGTRTPYGERQHRARMNRWARRYDALNGEPECECDQ
jgi:hypothetical protein